MFRPIFNFLCLLAGSQLTVDILWSGTGAKKNIIPGSSEGTECGRSRHQIFAWISWMGCDVARITPSHPHVSPPCSLCRLYAVSASCSPCCSSLGRAKTFHLPAALNSSAISRVRLSHCGLKLWIVHTEYLEITKKTSVQSSYSQDRYKSLI